MKDPKRVVELDSGVSPRLRALLQAGREDLPSEQEIDKLKAALTPVLWPVAGIGAGAGAGAAASAGAGSALGKLGVAAIVAAGVGGATVWAVTSTDFSEPPAASEARPGGALPEKPAKPAPAREVSSPGPSEASGPGAADPPRQQRAPVATPTGPKEADLLQAAQAALPSNPKRAASLAREHQRRFPRGALAQEREVILIEALEKLGERQAAESRADEFKARYPGSAHQGKVDSVLK